MRRSTLKVQDDCVTSLYRSSTLDVQLSNQGRHHSGEWKSTIRDQYKKWSWITFHALHKNASRWRSEGHGWKLLRKPHYDRDVPFEYRNSVVVLAFRKTFTEHTSNYVSSPSCAWFYLAGWTCITMHIDLNVIIIFNLYPYNVYILTTYCTVAMVSY